MGVTDSSLSLALLKWSSFLASPVQSAKSAHSAAAWGGHVSTERRTDLQTGAEVKHNMKLCPEMKTKSSMRLHVKDGSHALLFKRMLLRRTTSEEFSRFYVHSFIIISLVLCKTSGLYPSALLVFLIFFSSMSFSIPSVTQNCYLQFRRMCRKFTIFPVTSISATAAAAAQIFLYIPSPGYIKHMVSYIQKCLNSVLAFVVVVARE